LWLRHTLSADSAKIGTGRSSTRRRRSRDASNAANEDQWDKYRELLLNAISWHSEHGNGSRGRVHMVAAILLEVGGLSMVGSLRFIPVGSLE
jgi:hypothetical protein